MRTLAILLVLGFAVGCVAPGAVKGKAVAKATVGSENRTTVGSNNPTSQPNDGTTGNQAPTGSGWTFGTIIANISGGTAALGMLSAVAIVGLIVLRKRLGVSMDKLLDKHGLRAKRRK